MIHCLFLMMFLTLAVADEPIVELKANCPDSNTKMPSLHLIADVPAYAQARCRNGDKELVEEDDVNFALKGSFDQSYSGTRCQFYKKEGINTYTVDVEVGWGESNSQIIQQRKIHTISCAYDDHGKAISGTENVSDWFLNAWEAQTLLGGNSSATFNLKVIDVLTNEITDHISIGRKIQLVAEDLSGQAFFRALSCSVHNDQGRYYLLRAGCGDGLVFPKTSGFLTADRKVFSPYFDAFKLNGADNTLEFECRFTECEDGPCNGDSCTVLSSVSQKRRKRHSDTMIPSIVAKTFRLRF